MTSSHLIFIRLLDIYFLLTDLLVFIFPVTSISG